MPTVAVNTRTIPAGKMVDIFDCLANVLDNGWVAALVSGTSWPGSELGSWEPMTMTMTMTMKILYLTIIYRLK